MNENYQEEDGKTTDFSALKLGFAVYVAGLVFLAVSIYFGWGNVAFFGYFIFGFALNRIVLRQIEWHHMHNTLSNVANAKLSSFLFWPLSYLFLFVQLFINRVL
ncbi:hypothetical protein [Neisseria elongata]|uniref:hypothetical protein n=1 Tax=Neisseria elongata TaxID=495 RepID=UPI00195A049F|nr:hypothetical protein [Neisseria elongata]MBM7064410.1 hypothetical protein [Neisseria elongata]